MRRNVNKLATLVMTGMLAVSMSFGAFADNEGTTGTTVETGAAEQTVYEGEIAFKKILTKTDENAPTPTAKITFSAESVPELAVAATATTPEIKAGVGTLTFTEAVFNTNAALTQKITGTFGNTLPFTEPGIYRYTVTEASNNKAITNDTNASKTLDVYVERNSNNNLEIKYSVLSNSTAAPDKKDGYTAKTTGFKNTYTTYDLTLEKQVTGSMGELTKEFDFTIALAGGPKSATITAKKNNTTDVTVTFDDAGNASITNLKLADDGTFKIAGLPDTTTYTITENLNAYDGYTVSTSGSALEQLTNATTNLSVSGNLSDHPATGAEKITFTNNRNAVTPTGVAMDIAPYALMVALAGGAAFTFLRKKESFED
ncbi:MAG: hypothetical protein E7232_13810 [Lachnospiraceae bacterium]|nr:hypothetical protein [Lachnospiraceae bacterium]